MSTILAILRAIFSLYCIHQFTTAAVINRKPMHASASSDTVDIITRIRTDGIQKRAVSAQEMSYSRELACRVDMVSMPGEYYYTETGLGVVCGTYFLADPEEFVEIEVMEFDATCGESKVEFFDGWSMSAGMFPAESEHQLSIDDRVTSLCSLPKKTRHIFRSSQNVAMISFKLTEIGNSIRISYKGKTNQHPCNIMAKEPSGEFTLRNFGQNGNCSFANIYPSKVSVMQMQVGSDTQKAQLKCTGESDNVQFLAGNAFETSAMMSVEQLCGHSGSPIPSSDNSIESDVIDPQCAPGSFMIPLMCQVSVVRLTSSGITNNTVNFIYNRIVTKKNMCEI